MDSDIVLDDVDAVLYNSLDLFDCEKEGCAHVSKVVGDPLSLFCSVPSASECPEVIKSHAEFKTVEEKPASRRVFEVWCRESCTDLTTVEADSIEEAIALAGEMVAAGQLTPVGESAITYGADEADTPEAGYTVVCEGRGEVNILHSSAQSVQEIIGDLTACQYEVLAIFRGQHEDVTEL